MTKISQAIDNNESTLGVFLDLAKAFDTAKHEILLRKFIIMELGELQMNG